MPLGFHITVYRQQNAATAPASFEDPQGAALAVWQTGPGGLGWLDQLVSQGQAICLGGSGYPVQYTAKAQYIIPNLRDGPPQAKLVWSSDPGDVLLSNCHGKTVKFPAVMDACLPEEWLIIDAWDES